MKDPALRGLIAIALNTLQVTSLPSSVVTNALTWHAKICLDAVNTDQCCQSIWTDARYNLWFYAIAKFYGSNIELSPPVRPVQSVNVQCGYIGVTVGVSTPSGFFGCKLDCEDIRAHEYVEGWPNDALLQGIDDVTLRSAMADLTMERLFSGVEMHCKEGEQPQLIPATDLRKRDQPFNYHRMVGICVTMPADLAQGSMAVLQLQPQSQCLDFFAEDLYEMDRTLGISLAEASSSGSKQ